MNGRSAHRGRHAKAARMVAFGALAALVAALLVLVTGACSGGEDEPGPRHATPSVATVTPTRTPTVSSTPVPEYPTELRVAFLNLASPLTIDADNTEAAETFSARLAAVVAELKTFDPDIVGFNEASRTAYGDAITMLARELKMEFFYARANPHFPGLTQDESDELVKKAGFEEGELILVKGSRFPVLRSSTEVLNPRSTESGEVRVGLHVVVKGPPAIGEIDVFITHLTGGDDLIREFQAADFATWVALERSFGATVVLLGNSEPAPEGVVGAFQGLTIFDVAGPVGLPTCCRAGLTGEQTAAESATDHLMSGNLMLLSADAFGDEPVAQPDGTVLYMSDHNGVMAVFALDEVAHLAP